MQEGQLGIRLVRRGLRFVVPALITSLLQNPANAQTEVRTGVWLDVLESPYTIRGSTAQALLTQMRTLGPGGRLTSFRYFDFLWQPTYEQLERAFGGLAGRCRVTEFKATFNIRATYPVWDRPPNAPLDLVEAWESFEDLIGQQRAEYREGIVEFGTRLRRQARRVEESCPLITARVEEVVHRLQEERNDAQRAAAESGQFVRLQWPPPGFSERRSNADVETGLRSAAAEPTPPREPRLRPEPVIPAIYSSLSEALKADLPRSGTMEGVAGLDHLGERQYLNVFGTNDTLTVEARFPFRAFTDVLVGTLASALEAAGVLDLQAPLSSYLPHLDSRLGGVNLAQLLAHRSGLDNALPRPSSDPSEVLDGIDGRALFTEPGAVYSYSAYSYPLVVEAIESVAGAPLAEVMSEVLLEPLGMVNTSLTPAPRGLPVTYTTAPDLLRFMNGWLQGDIGGVPVFPASTNSEIAAQGAARVFYGGVWRDYVGERPRVSLMCDSSGGSYAAGFQIFPATNTALVLWGRQWPANAARFLLLHLATQVGVGTEIFQPIRVRGTGGLSTLQRPSCTEPSAMEQRVTDPGSAAAAGDWPGRYTNGDRLFELQEQDGALMIPSERPLVVTHYSTDMYFVTLDGRALYPFRLITDEAGRRYVVVDHRAYLHDDDRPEN